MTVLRVSWIRRRVVRTPVAALGLVLGAAVPLGAVAQETGDESYLITGARIHTMVEGAEPIESGSILVRDGRIVELGEIGDIAPPAGVRVIEADGLEVYPGMMDSVSQLGLTEIGAISATVDTVELGEMNPHLRAATAIHPSSEHLPVARANGITHAVVAPGSLGGFGSGGAGISGQASIVHLDGWTVEEMDIEASAGMMVVWPTHSTRSRNPTTFRFERRSFREAKEAYDRAVRELGEVFTAARRYHALDGPDDRERDLRLEALGPVLSGETPLLVLAQGAREIRDAVAFVGEREGMRMMLLGGRDAWKEKELLAEQGIPVILGPTQRLPAEEDSPYDRPFTIPGELHAAGVTVAFATFGSSNSRLLPYEAGHSVGYGMPREAALRAITAVPAQLFGLDEDLGTIEEGKVANLILVTGDPLEIRSEVRQVFVNGVPVSMDNRHQRLYEQYRARPKPEGR